MRQGWQGRGKLDRVVYGKYYEGEGRGGGAGGAGSPPQSTSLVRKDKNSEGITLRIVRAAHDLHSLVVGGVVVVMVVVVVGQGNGSRAGKGNAT